MTEFLSKVLQSGEHFIFNAEYVKSDRITLRQAEMAEAATQKNRERERRLQEGRNLLLHLHKAGMPQ